jgi:hypothetical protein
MYQICWLPRCYVCRPHPEQQAHFGCERATHWEPDDQLFDYLSDLRLSFHVQCADVAVYDCRSWYHSVVVPTNQICYFEHPYQGGREQGVAVLKASAQIR